MNPVLPDTALELAATAARAFAALGGVDVARRAEHEPGLRQAEVLPALQSLGVDDLDPRDGEEALAAAAALCEAAGRVALPVPLPAMLLRRPDDGMPFAVVPADRARVDHGTLFEQWRVAPIGGPSALVRSTSGPLVSRLGPFVADLDATGDDAGPVDADVVHHLVLTAWQVLGTCDRAVELATEHVTDRVQFGKPLAAFQAVQFQLADAAVAVAGLRELAGFTIWQLRDEASGALADALALRLHALDVARGVLRTCQQLHGAAGVCDEYDISVLCRHVQPALRLPTGAERSADLLATAIEHQGFDGLFPHGALRA